MRKEYLLYGRGIRKMSSEHFQLGGSTAGKGIFVIGRGIRKMSSEHFQLGGSTAGNSQAFYTPANYTGCLENYSGIY